MNARISNQLRIAILISLIIFLATIQPATAEVSSIQASIGLPPRIGFLSVDPVPTGGLTTSEEGDFDSLSVTLSDPPAADVTVTVTVTSSDLSEGTITAGASLAFTDDDYNIAQTVTVTGADDAIIDGDVGYQVLLNPDDGSGQVSVGVTNTDNETPPTISIDDQTVVEGNSGSVTATFTVSLSTGSSLPITVDYATANNTATAPGDYTAIATTTLTFTPGGSLTQTVQVTVLGDTIDEGASETFFVDLSNPSNATITDSQGVGTITDDDGQPTLSIDDQTVVEGNSGSTTATFTVSLSNGSSSTITVDYATANNTATAPGDYTAIPTTTLTFTPGGSLTQTIQVTVIGDTTDEGASETFFVNLSNPSNATITDSQGVGTITDDDIAGVTVTPTSGLTTTEPSSITQFTVVLTSQPTANVVIGLSSSDTTEGTVSPASLTFNTGNWSTSQIVTVTGVDDFIVDGPVAYTIVTAAATSTDPNYGGFNPADVSVTNNDDDEIGFTATLTSVPFTTEGGTKATFTVVLDTLPDAYVMIALTSSDESEGTISPASLTFNPGVWDVPQTVTVTGINDFTADGDIGYTIELNPSGSADLNYKALASDFIDLINVDNDTPGFAVAPTTGLFTTEGQGIATINILLKSRPKNKVTLNFSSNKPDEGIVAVPSVDILPADWVLDVPYKLIVTGVDDMIEDGDVGYKVTITSESPDGDYDAFTQVVDLVNKEAPSIEWLLPVKDGQTYDTDSLVPILLRVKSSSGEEISRVHFNYWDYENLEFVDLADDFQAPFQTYIDPAILNGLHNQVFAYAYGPDSGILANPPTTSIHKWIWIFRRLDTIYRTYMPIVK